MSRSMPSPADARAALRHLAVRGWRMACRASAAWWHAAVQSARLAIGIPDYDNYVDHMRRRHPGRAPMTREEFFHERMLARYGRGRSRCC